MKRKDLAAATASIVLAYLAIFATRSAITFFMITNWVVAVSDAPWLGYVVMAFIPACLAAYFLHHARVILLLVATPLVAMAMHQFLVMGYFAATAWDQHPVRYTLLNAGLLALFFWLGKAHGVAVKRLALVAAVTLSAILPLAVNTVREIYENAP